VVSSNSSFWSSNYTTVNTKSANWDSAYNTLSANSATWATPVGTVMAFATSAVPSGWLKCNGQRISITSYQNLYDIIGDTYKDINTLAGQFRLPDLRGRFIRGWADNIADNTFKNVDFGRIFGSDQDDAFQGHWHFFTKRSDSPADIGAGGFDMFGTTGAVNITYNNTNTYFNNGFGTPRRNFETRPVNVALLYCIKY
jgi:microcystin-dependent protein